MDVIVFRRLLVGLIVSFAICAPVYAQNPDGSYRLVVRKLSDGIVLTPPAVQGMGTFKNGVYQLTLFWHSNHRRR